MMIQRFVFSLLALGAYRTKHFNDYYQFMNDAQFLTEQSRDCITNILHEIILGYINFTEKTALFIQLIIIKQGNLL